MTENETKTKTLAEDYKMVLNEAKAMECSKIAALYNIPLKSMELIVQALEKQTPKKISSALCPSCKKYLTTQHLNQKYYCVYCGQKLDWSVKNEID